MFTWCPFKVKHFLKCVTWIITFVLLLPYIVWLRLPKSSLEQVRECTAVPLAATSGPQVLWAEQAVLLHVVSERSSKEERRGENVLMLPDPERHHVSVPQLGLVPQGDDRVHQVWLMLSSFLSLFPTRLFHWVPALLIMAFVFFFCFVLFVICFNVVAQYSNNASLYVWILLLWQLNFCLSVCLSACLSIHLSSMLCVHDLMKKMSENC